MNLENWTRLRPLPLWRLRWLWSQSVLPILLCTTVLLFKLIPTSWGSLLNGSSTIHMRAHIHRDEGVNLNHHGPSAESESESDGISGFDPGRHGRQIGPQIEIKDSTWAEILDVANTSPFDWSSFSKVMSQANSEFQLERLHVLHSNAHWAFEFHRIRRRETEETDPPYMRTNQPDLNPHSRSKGIVAVSIVPNKVPPPPPSMTTTSVQQKRARRSRGTRRSRRRNWIEEILSASASRQ